MEKNRQSIDGAAIPVKGAMPKPHEKTAPSPAPAKEAAAHKIEVKTDKAAHGIAHTAKK